jgi:hypothetical protein
MTSWLLEQFLGRRIQTETNEYLRELARSPMQESRRQAADVIAALRAEPGPHVTLGTAGDQPVKVPLDQTARSFGLITGGTGSGKTMVGLKILEALIGLAPYDDSIGAGIIDPKSDLFCGGLFLLGRRLEYLARHDPEAHRILRERIFIYDFSLSDPIASYNLLVRPADADAGYFAATRADLLFDLLPGPDRLSLVGSAVLEKLLLLLSEFSLPITYVDEILRDVSLRQRLVTECRNESVKTYFSRQFLSVPKPTLDAVARRMAALFTSEAVRLSLCGTTAPDFTAHQDAGGRFVFMNCFGESIARSVRRTLQGMALVDAARSVYARQRKDRPFIYLLDEAQNFFATEKLRETMAELLATSRSFGTHFLLLTQNASTAVQDPRLLKGLTTNIRWSFSMRSDPADCAFLKPALPVTGRRPRPRTDPFAEEAYFSMAEERALVHDEIAALPDRVGWWWPRSRSREAIKIRTADLAMPQGTELARAVLALRRDATLGGRLSRSEYERLTQERDEQWREAEGGLGTGLEETYRRRRRELS